ncbi:Gfo/Idh/MocA family protein, partial [Candidatus Hydrogenedentota bacterium]
PNIGAAGAQLVGACDIEIEKAECNARRFGGTAYADMDEMLDRENPDGVIICIGPDQHAKLAVEVMKRGIPVYTEKPPALTADDALAVARAARETGVLCTTAFKKRYTEAYQRAKEWIIGFPEDDLYSISIDYASGQYKNDGTPRGSFLLDFAVHAIDLVGYLFGDVEEVFALSKGEDAYAVSLKFTNGAVGSMNLNDGRSFRIPTEEIEISVKGGNCMTIHNSSSWRIAEDQKACEWREPPTFVSAGDSGNETGHLAELVDFFSAITEGRTTRSNIYESYKSLVLYEAIIDSAASKKLLEVRYQDMTD